MGTCLNLKVHQNGMPISDSPSILPQEEVTVSKLCSLRRQKFRDEKELKFPYSILKGQVVAKILYSNDA